ncbi:hypothetical protein HK098_000284, partial [Nowakowskiella sp. JEL0407]
MQIVSDRKKILDCTQSLHDLYRADLSVSDPRSLQTSIKSDKEINRLMLNIKQDQAFQNTTAFSELLLSYINQRSPSENVLESLSNYKPHSFLFSTLTNDTNLSYVASKVCKNVKSGAKSEFDVFKIAVHLLVQDGYLQLLDEDRDLYLFLDDNMVEYGISQVLRTANDQNGKNKLDLTMVHLKLRSFQFEVVVGLEK